MASGQRGVLKNCSIAGFGPNLDSGGPSVLMRRR